MEEEDKQSPGGLARIPQTEKGGFRRGVSEAVVCLGVGVGSLPLGDGCWLLWEAIGFPTVFPVQLSRESSFSRTSYLDERTSLPKTMLGFSVEV